MNSTQACYVLKISRNEKNKRALVIDKRNEATQSNVITHDD